MDSDMAGHLQSLLKGLDASQIGELGKMWEDPEVNAAVDQVFGDFFQQKAEASDPKERNLKPGQRVRLSELKGRPSLNGRTGKILEFDRKKNRYQVKLDDDDSRRPETISVKAENLEAGTGSCEENMVPKEGRIRELPLQVDDQRGISLKLFEDLSTTRGGHNSLESISGSGAVMWPAAQIMLDFFKTWPDESLRHRSGKGLRVVELGAGLGAPGLYLAKRGANVLLTDLPEMMPILKRNAEANFSAVCVDTDFGCSEESAGSEHGAVGIAPVRWTEQANIQSLMVDSCDIVIAADCTNEDSVLPAFLATIRGLCHGVGSRAFVAVECRRGEVETFIEALESEGLQHKVCWPARAGPARSQEAVVLELLLPWARQLQTTNKVVVQVGWDKDPVQLSVDLSFNALRLQVLNPDDQQVLTIHEITLIAEVDPWHSESRCIFHRRPFGSLEISLMKSKLIQSD